MQLHIFIGELSPLMFQDINDQWFVVVLTFYWFFVDFKTFIAIPHISPLRSGLVTDPQN